METNDIIITGRSRDLGGMPIARVLPSRNRRHVGPFVFLDRMGPFQIDPDHKLNVPPHPHIGLSTVTYLFSGSGFHRDSLGSSQRINPGSLNWMTSGRGIVHSERTPDEELEVGGEPLHGIQIWVALPVEFERVEPHFKHYPKEVLPPFELASGHVGRLLIGQWGEWTSPVDSYSRTLFVDVRVGKALQTVLSVKEKELAFFLVSGELSVNGHSLQPDDLIVINDPSEIKLGCGDETRFIILGGEPMPEPRHIWWNFVASKKEYIHQAAQDWSAQQMGQVPGEVEFTPLPEQNLP